MTEVQHLEALDREITAALAAEAVGALSYLDDHLTGLLKDTNSPPPDDPLPEVERYSRRRLRDAMDLVQDEVIDGLKWDALAAILDVPNIEFLHNTLRDPVNVKGHIRRQIKRQMGGAIGPIADYIDSAWTSGLLKGYETGGGWAARTLTGGRLTEFSLRDANIRRAIQARSAQLSDRFSDNFLDHLSGFLTKEMLEEGRGPLDARRYLRGRAGWNNLTGWQIDRIARTEALVSVNWGKFDTLRMNGVKVVEWQTHIDGLTRESHRWLDGQQIEIGGSFSNGLRFPGDPRGSAADIINCRCVLAPVNPDRVDPNRFWAGGAQSSPMPVALDPMRADSQRMVENVYERTMQNGGATWNPRTGKYQHKGYAVGLVNDTFAKVPVGDRDAFRRAVNRLRTEHPDAYVGTWDDGEGFIHIDPSEVHRTRRKAIEAARERDQLALYHLDTGTEIDPANPLKDVTEHIRRESGPLSHEKAYVIDPNTGEIEYEKHGDTYAVSLPREVDYFNKVLVHNHPRFAGEPVSMPPSDGDFGAMVTKRVAEERIVASDGTYIITKSGGWPEDTPSLSRREEYDEYIRIQNRHRYYQTQIVTDPEFKYAGLHDYGGPEGHRYVLDLAGRMLAEELGYEFTFIPAEDDIAWGEGG